MFPYSVVESALAEFFEVRPQGRPALRARIRNLQRLGLVHSSPGKGKRAEYTRHDVYDLALALSLAEFGVDPRLIIEEVIPGLIKSLDKAGNLKKSKWYCVYRLAIFASGRNDLRFETESMLKKSILREQRMALINVTDMIQKIDESLEA